MEEKEVFFGSDRFELIAHIIGRCGHILGRCGYVLGGCGHILMLFHVCSGEKWEGPLLEYAKL